MRIKIYKDDNSFIKQCLPEVICFRRTMPARSHLLPKNNICQKSPASRGQLPLNTNQYLTKEPTAELRPRPAVILLWLQRIWRKLKKQLRTKKRHFDNILFVCTWAYQSFGAFGVIFIKDALRQGF